MEMGATAEEAGKNVFFMTNKVIPEMTSHEDDFMLQFYMLISQFNGTSLTDGWIAGSHIAGSFSL